MEASLREHGSSAPAWTLTTGTMGTMAMSCGTSQLVTMPEMPPLALWHFIALFAVVGGARSAPGQRLHLAKPGNAAGGRKTKSDVFFARSDLRYRPPGLGCGRERSVRANRENLARSRSCSQPEAALGPSEHHGVHSGDAGTGSCTRWRDWQGAGRSDEAAVPDPAPAQGGQGAAV